MLATRPNDFGPTPTTEFWSPGTEVVAEYTFPGSCSEDLSFQKNDVLVIVAATKDPFWYKARRKDSDKTGMVPANYIRPRKTGSAADQSQQPAWLHGRVTRDEAERLLSGTPDGTFLVRESTNFPGDFTLCVSFAKKVQHYRIQLADGKLTCDDEEFFSTLPDLIQHYELDADGLCHKLIRPVTMSAAVKSVVKADLQLDEKVTQMKAAGMTIRREELTLGDAIGKGEFADVFIGRYNGQKVAVKVLKNSGKVAESILSEASMMTSLRSPNLVRLLGVVLDDIQEIYMVMEFMPNGSLVDYLRTRGRLQVTRRQQINFACDVATGMSYLESKMLVHRDLAARNVLLGDDIQAKVSDFGLAKEVGSLVEDVSGKFPVKWTAPEALKHSKFTSKSDMWSFGILLWEIYSFGRVPYPRIPVQDVVRHIEKGYRMEPPEGCPVEVSDLMTSAWAQDPANRPTFSSMLEKLERIRSNTNA